MSGALIGLYSPAPRCGKTTLANSLVTAHGYTKVSFADPLRAMMVPFLESLGYRQDEAERLIHVDKATVIPAVGVSVRHLLQTLGTEWGRTYASTDVWLRCWTASAARHQRVVADDVRFPNEADLIRSMGGELWMVRRPGLEVVTGHRSDGNLADWSFDRVIVNDGTLEDLTRDLL